MPDMKNFMFINLLVALGFTILKTKGQSDGDLRLVSNSSIIDGSSSGRLEFFVGGRWGTVCSDSFDASDARVACRQLGFSDDSFRYGSVGSLGFSQASPSTPILLDEIHCSGSESRLIDCSSSINVPSICSHFEDVALICTRSPSRNPASIYLPIIGSVITLIGLIIAFLALAKLHARSRHRRQQVQGEHGEPTESSSGAPTAYSEAGKVYPDLSTAH